MTCPKCKKDFLTEADPFITVPSSKGYTLYCICELTRLKDENGLMREGLEFYGSDKNWQSPENQGYESIGLTLEGLSDMIDNDDDEKNCGGKRAREILKTINEKKGE